MPSALSRSDRSPSEVGTLVADDRHRLATFVVSRGRPVSDRIEGRHVDAVRDGQDRTPWPAGGGDRIGDLLADADPDRSLGEVTIEMGRQVLARMPHALDEVDPGVCQRLQAILDQDRASPFLRETECREAAGSQPSVKVPSSVGQRSFRSRARASFAGSSAERHPRREAGHAPDMVEIVRVLDLAAGQIGESPVKPDRSCVSSRHEAVSPACAFRTFRPWQGNLPIAPLPWNPRVEQSAQSRSSRSPRSSRSGFVARTPSSGGCGSFPLLPRSLSDCRAESRCRRH